MKKFQVEDIVGWSLVCMGLVVSAVAVVCACAWMIVCTIQGLR